MSLKSALRAKRILKVLLQQGNTSVDDLVKLLDISAASVRRDLTKLESQGLVHRTHGGVTLAGEATYEPFRFDASFQIREGRFADEKRRIALAAAELIQERQTIGLTAGTTTTQLARCIRHLKSVSLITNAINIGMELANQPGLKVTLTGGSVQWAGAFSMVGPTALDSLEHIFLDILFLGACGVDPMRGVTAIEADEALIFRVMASHARQVVVLADSSKMGMVSPALICGINAVHTIVTDDGISGDLLALLRATGVKLIVV
ncbi:DeoR/GlpR family DNA-binding transcription regulator [Edaphobacter aggregans]|uniref:DeoR/GlpR family DNA-binding transcription regulator n=1 Tax=Edaphobacter aggregans TaxID=570835 RepID=UPI0005549C1C|nr:DeoR/GlpR family DNA-binding transcription regulator [Edaphobacter aggregans]